MGDVAYRIVPAPQMWGNHFDPLLRVDALARVEKSASRKLETLGERWALLKPHLPNIRDIANMQFTKTRARVQQEP